jgi:hypothetical protein
MPMKASERMSDTPKYLSIEDIDSTIDTRYSEVQAWGGTIRLGSLNAGDMMEFVESNEGPARRTAGIRLIVKSIVDKDGRRIGEPKHIEIFKKKDATTIAMLVNKIMELNDLNPETKVKNESSEANTGASLTDSPSKSVM